MTSGIYKIINKINNKFYIGSAINMEYRFTRHKRDLKNNRHVNKRLQKSWNKHGEQNFIFQFIETCPKEELIKKEQYYIDTINPEYNICRIAGSQFGVKHSDESRKRQSERMRGNKYCAGRKMTDEMRKILKDSRIGLPPPFKGKHHSEKFKKKQSEFMKGNKYCVGRKPTLDNIEKMQNTKRKNEMKRLDDKKKIDYLSLDISDWLEKRK